MKKLICCFRSILFLLYFAANAQTTPSELKNLDLKKFLPDRIKFLENAGQIMDMSHKPATSVLFKAQMPGINIYVTKTGLSYVFLKYEEEQDIKNSGVEAETEETKISWERVDMVLDGANIQKENIVRDFPSVHHFNYLGHPAGNIYGVKEYDKITIKEVYPGVDWVIYSSDDVGFKYDFVVHPGADYHQIKMTYHTDEDIALDYLNNIKIKGKLGSLTEHAPTSFYQEGHQLMQSQFVHLSTQRVKGRHLTTLGFKIAETGLKSATFIIDPLLTWSTFFGGNDIDGELSIDTDSNGNLFATGYTTSLDFPLQNAGSYFITTQWGSYILKFNNLGVLLWSTHFPAKDAKCLVVDKYDNVFLTGTTPYANFPVLNSSTFFQGSLNGVFDAFITKFDNNGNIVWSTFYGGGGIETGESITCDNNGNVFLSGTTSSSNFPLQNAGSFFQGTLVGSSSGFLVKFDNAGNRLWSTYYAGMEGKCLATDQAGNLYATGGTTLSTFSLFNPGGGAYFQAASSGTTEAYLVKFDNLGNCLWATFYGGSGVDVGTSVVCDKNGNVFVLGATTSTNFPTQNAGTFFQNTFASTFASLSDMFILKFTNTGTRLWATYFGGSAYDGVGSWHNMEMDSCDNLHLSFTTQSPNMLTMPACEGGHYDNSFNGKNDLYLARFSNSGQMLWGTYFGGDGTDFRSALAIDKNNSLFITGEWNAPTNVSSYPIVSPGGGAYFSNPILSDDGYYAKLKRELPAAQSFSYNKVCTGEPNQVPVHSAGYIPGGSYLATPGLSVNPVSGIITSSASLPGTYTVSYGLNSQTCSCMPLINFSISTVVTVIASPTIAIASVTSICIGSTATLTASNAGNYLWGTSSSSTTISSSNSIVVGPGANTAYWVSTTGTNGCSGTATILLQVNPLPTVAIIGTHSVCQNTSAVLTGSGAVNYTWTGGITTSTLGITPAANTTYTVFGIDANGCAKSASFNVVITPAPKITVSPSKTVCAGESVSVTASGANFYSWTGGGTTATQYFTPLTTTNYTVTGTGLNGCASTASVTMVTNPCIGIEEQSDISTIEVFPNPSKGSFTIISHEEITLQLVDLKGVVILEFTLNRRNNFTTSASNLSEGLYFLVDHTGHFKGRKKIIVN